MTLKYKGIDRSLLNHSIEKRGFVLSPFDHDLPEGKKIEVFYRLVPAYGSTVDDERYPFLVVINGGPGYPSSAYRPLSFNYANPSANGDSLDRFKYLSESFRILIIDQRGTDGLTCPLDMTDPGLDANLISRHFSSDSQARDHAAVIHAVIPKEQPFYMIAQSYGGMVGMQYLSLTLSGARKPRPPRGAVKIE